MFVLKLVAIVRSPTTYDPTDGKIHHWPSLTLDENLQMIAKVDVVWNGASIAHSKHQYVSTGSLRPFPFSEVNNVQWVSSLLIYIIIGLLIFWEARMTLFSRDRGSIMICNSCMFERKYN
jgi:hypothetical protein